MVDKLGGAVEVASKIEEKYVAFGYSLINTVVMTPSPFQAYGLKELQLRKRFSDVALCTVWTGGIIGIIAAIAQIFIGQGLETTTLIISALALLLSIPEYRTRIQIERAIIAKQQSA